MPRHRFEAGNSGRPLGAKNKGTLLKTELEEAFERNWDKAVALIDKMFDVKKDFQWLCELRASLEPKKLESDGSFAPKTVVLIRNEEAIKKLEARKNNVSTT